MKRTIDVLLTASALLLLGCETPATTTGAGPQMTAPAALERAHAAYLEGDLDTLSESVRAALTDPGASDAVRANGVALVEAAYAVGEGTLPADWALPPGVRRLQLAQVREEEPDGTSFRLVLGGVAATADEVADLRLTRGGAAVLDRRERIGAWSVQPETDGGVWFEIEGPSVPEPAAAGLYDLELTTRDGAVTKGWVVLSGHVSSRSPDMLWPTPGADVTTATLEVRFAPFQSPEHRRWERRNLSLWVIRLRPGAGAEPTPAWTLWRADPADGPIRIGREPDGEGAAALTPGRYWVGLTFAERRRFGPIDVVRASRRSLPFTIR